MKIDKIDTSASKIPHKVQNNDIASQMSQLEISILEAKEQIIKRNQQIIVKSNKEVDVNTAISNISARREKKDRKTTKKTTTYAEVNLDSDLDLHK